MECLDQTALLSLFSISFRLWHLDLEIWICCSVGCLSVFLETYFENTMENHTQIIETCGRTSVEIENRCVFVAPACALACASLPGLSPWLARPRLEFRPGSQELACVFD